MSSRNFVENESKKPPTLADLTHVTESLTTELLKMPLDILPGMKISLCLNEPPQITKYHFKAVIMDCVYYQHIS